MWIVNTNAPGYLPDGEAGEFMDYPDAIEALRQSLTDTWAYHKPDLVTWDEQRPLRDAIDAVHAAKYGSLIEVMLCDICHFIAYEA